MTTVAIASFSDVPPQFRDDERLADALRRRAAEVGIVAWDDAEADWDRFDAVVIRSTWDYSKRRDEFVAWADRIGDRLHNSPAIVRWNSDKRYLGDLGDAGIAVVETSYVAPGDPVPALDGEVVVKPNVSAGGRDTGRFGPRTHNLARELIESIQASDRIAMVQPYQRSVDGVGETAVLCIDGEPVHSLRKGPVLRPDEVAPIRDDGAGVAEVMYDPELVVAADATEAELANARAVVAHVAERFGYLPLYARVDTIRGANGEPVLLELEAIEPSFYLDQVPSTTAVVADAIIARAGRV
jgi:hypothetical protein